MSPNSLIVNHEALPGVKVEVAVVGVTELQLCSYGRQSIIVQLLHNPWVTRFDPKHKIIVPLLKFFREVYEFRLVDTSMSKASFPRSLVHNLWSQRRKLTYKTEGKQKFSKYNQLRLDKYLVQGNWHLILKQHLQITKAIRIQFINGLRYDQK